MRSLVAVMLGVTGSSWYTSMRFPQMQCATASSKSNAATAAAASPFSPREYRPFKLMSVYDESHDTKVFRFALPHADMTLNLPIASCISLRYVDKDGKEVVRPYTPINRNDQKGYFDVLVKRYKGSKMGSHLFAMKKDDTIDVMGPWPKLPIRANQYKTIGMIAGGTGITPMYQIAHNVLREPGNKTDIALIYANKRKEDVLLGNELNELMETNEHFSPYFVLSKAPSDWMGGVGHISKEMIKAKMPAPTRASDSIIFVCGPPAFMQTISGDKDFSAYPPAQGQLSGYLKEMGYPASMVYKF